MIINLIHILLMSMLWMQGAGEMKIVVSNIYPAEGQLFVALYRGENGFMKADSASYRQIVEISAERHTIVFNEIEEGEYAVAIFQDVNGNGKLDMKKARIPNEPFGFSNDARSKIGPPGYEKAKFYFSGDMEINIRLVNNEKK